MYVEIVFPYLQYTVYSMYVSTYILNFKNIFYKVIDFIYFLCYAASTKVTLGYIDFMLKVSRARKLK